jgi:hypothetical protein
MPIPTEPYRVSREILRAAQSALVDWAEREGFNWISVDVCYSPYTSISMTVKHSTYPDLSARIAITNMEFKDVGIEYKKLYTLTRLKCENTLRELRIKVANKELNASSVG